MKHFKVPVTFGKEKGIHMEVMVPNTSSEETALITLNGWLTVYRKSNSTQPGSVEHVVASTPEGDVVIGRPVEIKSFSLYENILLLRLL